MQTKYVLACFSNENNIHHLLSELREIGAQETDISFIVLFDRLEHLLGTVLGPLKSTDIDNLHSKLSHLGFSVEVARNVKNYLKDGGVVGVIACEEEGVNDLINILKNYNATLIEVSE